MALSPRLELRQGQGLVITPQLQQAIKLLQLSQPRAGGLRRGRARAQSAVAARGPRRRGRGAGAPTPRPSADETSHRPHHRQRRRRRHGCRVTTTSTTSASPGDQATGDAGAGGGADAGGSVDWSKAGRGGGFDDERRRARRRRRARTHPGRTSATPSWPSPASTAADRAIALGADRCGGRGRLSARRPRRGRRAAGLRRGPGRGGADASLQGFEPTGVFARDVAECLALQLKEKDRFDPAMAALVGNLELLARRDMAAPAARLRRRRRRPDAR